MLRELLVANVPLNYSGYVKFDGGFGNPFVTRIYAGTLGLLAFLATLTRGLRVSHGIETVLGAACASLAIFAALGWAVGGCARWIVEDAVRQRLAAEVAAQEPTQPPSTRPARN